MNLVNITILVSKCLYLLSLIAFITYIFYLQWVYWCRTILSIIQHLYIASKLFIYLLLGTCFKDDLSFVNNAPMAMRSIVVSLAYWFFKKRMNSICIYIKYKLFIMKNWEKANNKPRNSMFVIHILKKGLTSRIQHRTP